MERLLYNGMLLKTVPWLPITLSYDACSVKDRQFIKVTDNEQSHCMCAFNTLYVSVELYEQLKMKNACE